MRDISEECAASIGVYTCYPMLVRSDVTGVCVTIEITTAVSHNAYSLESVRAEDQGDWTRSNWMGTPPIMSCE